MTKPPRLDYYQRKELLIGKLQELRKIMRQTRRINLSFWIVQVEEFTALGPKSIRVMLESWMENQRILAHIEGNELVSDHLTNEDDN